MKRKITVSIALVMSIVLVLLTSSDSQAQGNRRAVYDTGMITLGQNQILRITINGGDGNDQINLRLREMKYMTQSCNDGVCRALVNNEVLKEVVFSGLNQTVWVDIDRTTVESAVRGIFISSRPVRVNAQIIDATTGEVQSIIAVLIG